MPRKKPTKTAADRNKDRHKQPRLVFHLPQDLYEAFQGHVAALVPEATEAAVLRLALSRYLESVGAWPVRSRPDQADDE